eukprot:CAMPEP_0172539824 /NCGR_PEP_ID=MMETSP1067-20121228/10946_1 /TAXON_ID=265564 ORGANISM="Thalassiosira punctigera, Strain Tpunct2005C2" /NCGR_SAMPLE_ID=MMETSP1067 /ASSEMBLY_ACC=CAM_ASM_000444 /LENGTH=415 /DNA_ID=CAMNT_0013325567 /DNA_START=81 /DNA_END=1328 /DNA_ORIENTATION=+
MEVHHVHSFFRRCVHNARRMKRRHPSAFTGISPQQTIFPSFATYTVHSRRKNNMLCFTSTHLQNVASGERIVHHQCRASKSKQDRRQSRRRRGAIHSHQRSGNPLKGSLLIANAHDESSPATITRYTIDDSTCAPTDRDSLKRIVQKHIRTLPIYWKSRPVANHTAEAFEEAMEFVIRCGESLGVSRTKVILDSGCGTGRSSFLLGERHPDCVVIGIDQSLARLSRNKSYSNWLDLSQKVGNVLLLRAELSDFWKCCVASPWWLRHVHVVQHYLLYPNPYPKKSRLKSRFYAHPAFPLLMMTLTMDGDGTANEIVELREKLILRSNWKGYLEEFKLAVGVWGEAGGNIEGFKTMVEGEETCDEWQPQPSQVMWETVGPALLDGNGISLTNFEAKYMECGEPIYELAVLKTSLAEE